MYGLFIIVHAWPQSCFRWSLVAPYHIAYVVYSRTFSLLSVDDFASHFMENIKNFQRGISASLYTFLHPLILLSYFRGGWCSSLLQGQAFHWGSQSHSSTYPSKLLHSSTSISSLTIFLSSQSDNVFKSCILKKFPYHIASEG